VGSCLALGLSVVGGGSAGATVAPATGTVTCGVAAGQTGTLKPGLPMSGQPATVKWTMEKIHQVTLDTCDSSGVSGGKSVITAGVVQINARLDPGASCDSLAASLSAVNKATVMVKFTATVTTTVTDPITGQTTTTTQTRTSASVHVKSVTAVQSGSGVLL